MGILWLVKLFLMSGRIKQNFPQIQQFHSNLGGVIIIYSIMYVHSNKVMWRGIPDSHNFPVATCICLPWSWQIKHLFRKYCLYWANENNSLILNSTLYTKWVTFINCFVNFCKFFKCPWLKSYFTSVFISHAWPFLFLIKNNL